MVKNTTATVSPATENANRQRTAQGAPDSPALRLADVPTGGIQLRLPHLRFDAKRGCDRIRRRIYADPRIRPLVAFVLMALSEFTDVRRKAWPKQELIAKMVHTNIPRVSRLLSEAADLGVLAKDRNRPGGRCCYTFAESWVRWFSDGEQTCRSDKSEPESPRLTVAGATSLDLPERQVSTEPVQVNQDQDPAAEEDRTSLLEIAREPAPAFDTGSAFLPGSLCPSCRMVDSGGAVCSRCCAVGSEGARLPARPAAEPAYLAAGDYGARPSADWNAGGD